MKLSILNKGTAAIMAAVILAVTCIGNVAKAVEVNPSTVKATVAVPSEINANLVLCTSEIRAKSFVRSAVLAGKAGWEGEVLAIQGSRDVNDMCAVMAVKAVVEEVLVTGVSPDGHPLAAIRVTVAGKTLYSPTVGVVFTKNSGT